MNVQIERAHPEDVPKLIEVQDLAFREEFERYGECPPYQESPAAMLELVEQAIVYTIRVEGRTVGDIIVRDRGDGRYYLRTISIVPELQGRGIGRTAIGLLERDLPDAVEWTLETPEGTPRNHAFYEGLGYRRDGATPINARLTLLHYAKTMAEPPVTTISGEPPE